MDLLYSDESKTPYMLLFVQRSRLRYEIDFSQVMLLILEFDIGSLRFKSLPNT